MPYVSDSSVHGQGVFADRDYAQGDTIELCPYLIADKDDFADTCILHDYMYTDDDKRIHFSTKDPEGDMPKIIRILSESGAHIQRIETDKSSLEDVFLNLTGKGINK